MTLLLQYWLVSSGDLLSVDSLCFSLVHSVAKPIGFWMDVPNGLRGVSTVIVIPCCMAYHGFLGALCMTS